MSVFVDTSALYAIVDPRDESYRRANSAMLRLGEEGVPLVTSNYVALESISLAHRRLGSQAAAHVDALLGLGIEVLWVDADMHREALAALLAERGRASSLVDHVSFRVMRERELKRAFAFDSDFARAGFEVLPA